MSPEDPAEPAHQAGQWTRRDLLRAGSATAAALALPHVGPGQATAAARRRPARSCILLFLVGGPSQLDTFDPKPTAPREYRGPYRPIRTNISGIYVSELFPGTARQADKFAIVRSMHHTAAAVHETGHQLMQTGWLFQGGIEYPHAGCVLGLLDAARSDLPAHIVLPGRIGNTGGSMPHGQSAGYLGPAHDPLIVQGDPTRPDFRLLTALPPEHLEIVRAHWRAARGEAVARTVAYADEGPEIRPRDIVAERLLRLISSRKAREAFELSREPDPLRDAYGRGKFGQSCLLARRLVEAGARFVTINMYERISGAVTWDCHGSDPFSPLEAYRNQVAPAFDAAYATLLEDLAARGMLEDTLVVSAGEFGRTPKLNPAGGRDHWTGCWSVLFAGGGVKGGQVIGSSDERGAYPKDRPTAPAEVVASIYHSMGIDPTREIPGPQGRPLPLVDSGIAPIRELF